MLQPVVSKTGVVPWPTDPYQRLNRVWRDHISSSERDLLLYLIDATWGYKRETLCATLDEMVAGDGVAPVGLSKSTLHRTLLQLQARGIVSAQRFNSHHAYKVIFAWEPAVIRQLAIPKRLQQSMSFSAGNSQPTTADVLHFPARITPAPAVAVQPPIPNLTPRIRTRPVQPTTPAPPAPTLTAVQAIAVVKTKPVAPTTSGRKLVTLEQTWRDAWREAYPQIPVKPFANQDRFIARATRKRVEELGTNWLDFVFWVVIEWRSVMTQKFSWMTKRPTPQYPELGFICANSFLPQFMDCYSSRLANDALSSMSTQDAAYARLRERGLSHDQCMIEIGKSQSAGAESTKMRQAREHLATQARALEADRKALKASAEVRPHAPAQGGQGMRRFIARPAISQGANPYEHPEAEPDLEGMLSSIGSWED